MLLGSIPLHSLMVNIWHVFCKFYRPLNGFSQRDFIYNSLLLSQQPWEVAMSGCYGWSSTFIYLPFIYIELAHIPYWHSYPILYWWVWATMWWHCLPASTVGSKAPSLWGLVWTVPSECPFHPLLCLGISRYRIAGSCRAAISPCLVKFLFSSCCHLCNPPSLHGHRELDTGLAWALAPVPVG